MSHRYRFDRLQTRCDHHPEKSAEGPRPIAVALKRAL